MKKLNNYGNAGGGGRVAVMIGCVHVFVCCVIFVLISACLELGTWDILWHCGVCFWWGSWCGPSVFEGYLFSTKLFVDGSPYPYCDCDEGIDFHVFVLSATFKGSYLLCLWSMAWHGYQIMAVCEFYEFCYKEWDWSQWDMRVWATSLELLGWVVGYCLFRCLWVCKNLVCLLACGV